MRRQANTLHQISGVDVRLLLPSLCCTSTTEAYLVLALHLLSGDMYSIGIHVLSHVATFIHNMTMVTPTILSFIL